MQYTRGYIMQMIDVVGLGCTGLLVLADVLGNIVGQRNLGGCMTLLLSWAYHRIPACRPVGFEQRHFPVVERWIGYEPPRNREETRLRGWRWILNRLGITDVVWTPYADPLLQPVIPPWLVQSIGTWHVACPLLCFPIVERDACSRRSLGQGEWYPNFLQGWYEMWRWRAAHRLPLDLHPDIRPIWYLLLGGRAGPACAARSP
ncbi:hypothetical protein PIB30_083960 [Stylosanthes scabra]|uniref:Aminotransferase-like plant mobile domain-containing protein n=1 Tax=Stylosanthes scabra TaxID=79078 RepID=A0ABU6WTC3_9FABA|nr:hypothetical protein [Stylosanthes scabra]